MMLVLGGQACFAYCLEDQIMNRLRWLAALMGSVATLLTWEAAAWPADNPREGFVVHEWGTFSTFSGSNGAFLKFYPNDRDLPAFVYNRHRDVKGGLPDVYVSLETPVMYFYSDRERTASVHVGFPKGRMTDWYPQASRPPVQGLVWDDLKILPRGLSSSQGETGQGRYFVARETDSSAVIASDKGKKQYEKFLFYRGVGDFAMPFTVTAQGDGAFKVKNSGSDAIAGLFLVRVEGRKVFFKVQDRLAAGAEVSMRESTVKSTAEKLGDAVAGMLVKQGLYEKEARAMVKTWSTDWFGEDGTRVLYFVPESLTREFLPLSIEPKPDRLVRVLVGRHDILTPERELQVDALVRQLHSPSNAESQAADETLNKMGRYRWAAQTAADARLKSRGEPQRRGQ
jgi:hypothetical protein